MVQTVHNYRHSCPAGYFFREGTVCEDCSGKALPWPAVVHGCYRGSRPQSAVMAAAARAHRATWRMVDRFIAVSEFVAQHLADSGVPRERISRTTELRSAAGSRTIAGSGFVFVGRLTAEKGVSLLVSAWIESRVWEGQRLVVAGDGAGTRSRARGQRPQRSLPGQRRTRHTCRHCSTKRQSWSSPHSATRGSLAWWRSRSTRSPGGCDGARRSRRADHRGRRVDRASGTEYRSRRCCLSQRPIRRLGKRGRQHERCTSRGSRQM